MQEACEGVFHDGRHLRIALPIFALLTALLKTPQNHIKYMSSEWEAPTLVWWIAGLLLPAVFNLYLILTLPRPIPLQKKLPTVIFVLVCAYRAYFPNIYLKNVCLVGTSFSAIMLSR